MSTTKLEPGDRVKTYSGRATTIVGHTPNHFREQYPITAWAQAPADPENFSEEFDGHESLTLTKSGDFFLGTPGGLSLDLDTVVKFRDAMLTLATDPKGKWTDLPEETFLEIAEAVRDYLLLPK
jgi:hypothetical protein